MYELGRLMFNTLFYCFLCPGGLEEVQQRRHNNNNNANLQSFKAAVVMYRNNDNNIIIVISRIKHNYIICESDNNIMYITRININAHTAARIFVFE